MHETQVGQQARLLLLLLTAQKLQEGTCDNSAQAVGSERPGGIGVAINGYGEGYDQGKERGKVVPVEDSSDDWS